MTILEAFTAQKQQALTILMEVQNREVSLDEIYGLSKDWTLKDWAKNGTMVWVRI